MKKQVNKIALKTDKIVSLTKTKAQSIAGGRPSKADTYTADCD